MTDTTKTETTPVQPPPLALLTEVLRDPTLLVSRRGELVKLASDRVNEVSATARAGFETVRTGVAERAQELRSATGELVSTARVGLREVAVPARARSVAHDQLQRAARVLQDLANRIQPS
jgi:hypothetical protein